MWVRLIAFVPLLLPAHACADAKERPATSAPPESEVEAALLAASCSGCHVQAATYDAFPPIYGRPAAEIREAMLAFRSDERKGTVMNRIAKGYSEEDIGLLAEYIAAQGSAN